jgi:hypothetical protein
VDAHAVTTATGKIFGRSRVKSCNH